MIPFFKPIRMLNTATMTTMDKVLEIRGNTELSVMGLRVVNYQTVLRLSRDSGIREIILTREGKTLLKAKQIEDKENSNV
ncbi:MAG: hypothetical protein LRZ88_05430 [Candidatus Cloacimonetes bacterium]|nr:hypothetical protein [Candidatus Cloacimonadota bacterium]